MRIKKLKTDGNVGASIAHATRTRETPNADPERTPDNWYCWKGSAEDVRKIGMKHYRQTLTDKVRKNAVRALELMMTLSPEVMQNKKFKIHSYVNDCDTWAKKTFGEENVFFIAHHFDETTPHTSLFLTPKIDGKLNCRAMLGNRNKMSALQTDFYEQVGKKYELERGIQGSKARHQTISQYYAKANCLDKSLEPPEKKLFESQEAYKTRYKAQIAPLLTDALSVTRIKQQNKDIIEQTNDLLFKAKKPLQDAILGLKKDISKETARAESAEKTLSNWRSFSPDDLREIANDLERSGYTSTHDEQRQQQLKTRKSGFSRS